MHTLKSFAAARTFWPLLTASTVRLAFCFYICVAFCHEKDKYCRNYLNITYLFGGHFEFSNFRRETLA